MKVLLVGAGAVGQVYGYHLQRGCAEIAFYVRPKHVETLKSGVYLYPLNQRQNRNNPVLMSGFQVLSEIQEVRATEWDYVILCTASDALYTPWLSEFLGAVHNTNLVILQPGLDDRTEVLKHFNEDRLITGVITLISFHAPLPGDTKPKPGMAYWFPAFGKAPFQGSKNLVQPLLEVFHKGGFPCMYSPTQGGMNDALIPGTLLSTIILCLEACDWKFELFLSKERMSTQVLALNEAIDVVCKKYQIKKPFFMKFFGRVFFKLIILFAKLVMPFNLEVYLKVHFLKVKEQRLAGIRTHFENAKALSLKTPAFEMLAREIGVIP